MDSEEIDDLFRAGLGDHATPPPADLWARLQGPAADSEAAPAEAERLDELFRHALDQHPSPVRREVWERLEDEHLRPRRRRPVAWLPMALAAAVALLLVVGGGWFWSGYRPAGSGLATGGQQTAPGPAMQPSRRPTQSAPAVATVAPDAVPDAARPLVGEQPASGTQRQQNFSGQATRRGRATSGVASAAAGPNREARRPARPTPAALAAPAPAVAVSLPQAPQPDAAREQPTPVATPALASPVAVIEVDVRPGGGPGAAVAAPRAVAGAVAAATPEADPARPGRRLLGGLLRQANHLVRGEALSLADATGLPENVTLQAHLGRRTLTKTIQL